MERLWNPENLNSLIEKTGNNICDVARACNINDLTIRKWCKNESTPSFDGLMKLADFFAVPLDFICGRCDEETANDILKDYENTYEKIRRSEYETIMARKGNFLAIPAGYLAPWPYDLLDDIFQKPFDHMITADEEAGLWKALDTLYPREKECLLAYYQNGLSLKEVGKKYNVTAESIRMSIAKAVRKLRHPSRSRLIMYGVEGSNVIDEYKQKLKELECREKDLEAREEYANTYLKPLVNETVESDPGMPSDEVKYEKPAWGNHIIKQPSEAFLCLELSVRSFNCLSRANCISVADIIDHIRKGDLISFRNLGRKSLEEIMQKVSDYVGYDCWDIWGIDTTDKSKVVSAEDLKGA